MGPPKGLFLQTKTSQGPIIPHWSLQKVLTVLQSERFQVRPSLQDALTKALFLVAMATGHRISQLAALSRGPEFAKFAPDDTSVTLATKPGFLAKNERASHRMKPVVIHAWLTDEGHHPLCPVQALRLYLSATAHAEKLDLWLHPASQAPLRSATIAASWSY